MTAEEAVKASSELMIPGAFLVDIISVLKYVPVWFPGAKFQRKAAEMRKHAAIIRNKTFAATEELMVGDSSESPFLAFVPDDSYTFSLAGEQWLWSFVRHRGATKWDTMFRDLLPRHPSGERCCRCGVYGLVYPFYILFPSFYGAIPQPEQIPLLRQWELFFWRWSAIPRCRRWLKQNLTESSMEDFPNIVISLPFPTSRHSLKKFIGMLLFASRIHCVQLTVLLDGSL